MSINKNMQCSGKKEKTRFLQYCLFEAQKLVRKNLSLFIVPLMKI